MRLSDTNRHWAQDYIHDYRPRIPRDAYSSEVLGVSTQRLEQNERGVVEELAGRFIAECGSASTGERWTNASTARATSPHTMAILSRVASLPCNMSHFLDSEGSS